MSDPLRGLGRVVILVDDQAEALRFYREVLGFEILHDSEAAGFRYLHVGLPGQDEVGLWLMPAVNDEDRSLIGRQAGSQPLLVLYTDDLDALAGRLVAHDVEAWAQRTDETSRSLHFRDVAGNIVIAAELAS